MLYLNIIVFAKFYNYRESGKEKQLNILHLILTMF